MVLTKTGIACDYCGRFISYADLDEGRAVHRLLTPDFVYHLTAKHTERGSLQFH
jgi:hypothetical protein